MNKRDIILLIVFLFFISMVVLYNTSYSKYESSADITTDINVANWLIKINNTDITGDTKKIMIDDITWESCLKSNCEKIAPGMKGGMDINIDATGSDTAIKFIINIEDARNNNDYILTVTGVSSNDITIVKNSDYEYYGILSLENIKNNFKPTIHIDVEWVNDENNNDRDSSIGFNSEVFDYYDFDITALQYTGE